jgi:hypothetical protein
MANSKKACLQRQTSEKLQHARVATIIPIHRESIVNAVDNTVVRRPSGSMNTTSVRKPLETMTAGHPTIVQKPFETMVVSQDATVRRPFETMSADGCLPNGIATTVNQRRSLSNHLPPQVDQWMTKFCVEPPGDLDLPTCCLGFMVPCALYGKVDWRLKQKSLGRSVYAWRRSDGCNGPCWAYCACDGVLPVLSGKFSDIIIYTSYSQVTKIKRVLTDLLN